MNPLDILKNNVSLALGLGDTINFGKYAGKTMQWVVNNKPEYLDYLLSKDNSLLLKDEVTDALCKELDVREEDKEATSWTRSEWDEMMRADDGDLNF